MPFAKSIKMTLGAVAGFVAVAALTLLVRQRRPDGGGMSHATAYDFGEVVQGQPVEHEFGWRNTERTALAVDTVITAYASTLLAADSRPAPCARCSATRTHGARRTALAVEI